MTNRSRLGAELRSLRRRRREIIDKQTNVGAASGASGWNDSYTFEHRQEMNRAIRDGHGLSAIEERIEELEEQLAGGDPPSDLPGGHQSPTGRPVPGADRGDEHAQSHSAPSRQISRAVLLAVLAAIAVAILMTFVALAPRLIGPGG